MTIRTYTKDEERSRRAGNYTSMFEQRVPVPSWGPDGEFVQSFYVHNNKDAAVLYACTKAEGIRAPALDITTQVDMTVNDLDQFIADLVVIKEDLIHQIEKENARLTYIRAASQS